MIYSAINIGSIIATLGMARKPRELWAASYLFSYLMKCIIEALPKEKIISPATFCKDDKKGIGLYPDRVFIKEYTVSYHDMITPVIKQVAKDLNIDAQYFNVMTVSGDYNQDSDAIKDLNTKLNNLELYNIGFDGRISNKVRELIKSKYGSPLFYDAFERKDFPIESLGEIGAVELRKMTMEDNWRTFVSSLQSDEQKVAEKAYCYLPKEKLKSYHKYICVVQADGDNMGKVVSHSKLPEGKVKELSEALLKFGEKAKTAIDEYGGFPIYAGGDDLLFIAPVVGKDYTNIFQLLKKLDKESFEEVKKIVDECKLQTEDDEKIDIHASLSFGVSITYYKYPLYEALASARDLLFYKAKNIVGKNAIALNLRKHSGGAFYMELSNSDKDLEKAFENIILASGIEESVVSAMGHKIREAQGLFKLWIGQDDASSRNENYFKKYLEYNPNKADEKKTASDIYKDTALNLLNVLFNNNTDENKISQTMYAMLRIAKFIKGEEVKDE